VSIEVVGEPPAISADPTRIEQILTNLLENASKYSAAGEPIRVIVGAASGIGSMFCVRLPTAAS